MVSGVGERRWEVGGRRCAKMEEKVEVVVVGEMERRMYLGKQNS